MDYNQIIERLIAEFDIGSDIGRKKTNKKCVEYADSDLDFMLYYKPFPDVAAERLEQAPQRKDIVRRMVERSGDDKGAIFFTKDHMSQRI